jgi:2-keto-3-deoxy-L-fuconate dehydrogenase
MGGVLNDKIAIITAAGQGIGRATAERFVAEGARVIATDIDETLLETLENCEVYKLDVCDPIAIKKIAAEIGPVDVLFNCAGYVENGTILDNNEEQWDFSFDLNVKGAYRMIREFLPLMLNSGGGSIINMASVASSISGVANRCIYGASKAAVIGLTKSIATDFVKMNIRCNAICPGTVDSPSLQERMSATGDYKKAVKDFIARQPMGRLGQTAEIAALVTYLASDDAAFTTGQTHIIDGGWAI